MSQFVSSCTERGRVTGLRCGLQSHHGGDHAYKLTLKLSFVRSTAVWLSADHHGTGAWLAGRQLITS
jgi:hypothetical protein